MGDAIDGLRAAHDGNAYLKAERRKLANEQFDEARAKADSLGLTLERFSDTHYRIRTSQYFWDIHPGNQRIRRSSPNCPLITFPREWDLLSIVQHAADAIHRMISRSLTKGTDHGEEKRNQ